MSDVENNNPDISQDGDRSALGSAGLLRNLWGSENRAELAECRTVIVGSNRVGLTSAACLSYLGNTVSVVDLKVAARVDLAGNEATAIQQMQSGHLPIEEPNLQMLVEDGLASGLLRFIETFEPIESADVIMCCLEPDQWEALAVQVRLLVQPNAIVVLRPPTERTAKIDRFVATLNRADVHVTVSPVTVHEGSAVRDLLEPDIVLIGAETNRVGSRVAELFRHLDVPIEVVDLRSIETVG